MRNLVRPAFFVAATFAFVMAILPHPPPVPLNPPDKIQHMAAFLMLGWLGALAFPRRSGIALFVGLSLYGALIEVLQAIPALHRDCDIRDLLADMVAAGIAIAITRFIDRRRA